MKKGGREMSWIQKLYETYNNCQSAIGMEPSENEVPLLPICHTTQKAQIEIVIDGEGNFKRARVIPKAESRTIIPCFEKSGGRTSGEAPHPLCDKLQYVAKDYTQRGGSKKSYFNSYVEKLEEWCHSEFSDPKLIAVLKYVKKGNVIGDLIENRVLVGGEDGKSLTKWEKKKDEKPPKIFEVLTSQEDAFIRWEVEIPGVNESKVWKDKVLWEKWIRYYSRTKKEKSLCYVTGEDDFTADQHPAKLRNDGDKAKLISSNDSSGFTFRGRFLTAEQAASVGFETTQKAHFALRWLISRQGYRKGDLAIVAWATSGTPIPKPTDDPLSIIDVSDLPTDAPPTANTAQIVAVKLKKKIAGYGKEIGSSTDIVVMGLDSATPGRLAITYYRELTGSDFLQRINDWHESCAWIHYYGSIVVQDEKKYIPFIGAPTPSDIAEAAYATNRDGKFQLDEKLRKATIARILPCIIDGQQIPRDLVESAVRRASNRVALEDWQWRKTLTIACALYKKFKEKENHSMSLDENRTIRDYLYGRLLAIAERLEEVALYKAKEKRATNAARYMQQFSQRPFRTWNQIHSALTPYIVRLGGAGYYKNLIAEVNGLFVNPEDYMSDKPLTGEYLLGYYCQRQKLLERTKKDVPSQENEENAESAE
jgi:CRISPR-associated protein Csd1